MGGVVGLPFRLLFVPLGRDEQQHFGQQHQIGHANTPCPERVGRVATGGAHRRVTASSMSSRFVCT